MFEWKVEDMILFNQKCNFYLGKEKIYDCESKVSREDKIAFVDKFQDDKLTYILKLIEKFNQDQNSMPKRNPWGSVKTVSLKAWIKRNDNKYNKPVIDNDFHYGQFRILDIQRNITSNIKNKSDIYDDLVDEAFHRQLKICEQLEREYFEKHDEYSILKKKFRDRKYRTTFGVNICEWGNSNVMIVDDENKLEREITIDELKDLLEKHRQLEAFIDKITSETHIVY